VADPEHRCRECGRLLRLDQSQPLRALYGSDAVTTPRHVPAARHPPQRRGADGAFAGVVQPRCAADANDPDMRELRAIADASAPRTSRHWLRALRFLRELDHLDAAHASGRLDAETYARCLEERYRTAPHETWLCAVGLARMVDRIIMSRQTEEGRGS
jgi:hypothetical protein